MILWFRKYSDNETMSITIQFTQTKKKLYYILVVFFFSLAHQIYPYV